MPTKVKIVLDADVIIHFTKGGILHLLPDFLPGYEFIVLDIVHIVDFSTYVCNKL